MKHDNFNLVKSINELCNTIEKLTETTKQMRVRWIEIDTYSFQTGFNKEGKRTEKYVCKGTITFRSDQVRYIETNVEESGYTYLHLHDLTDCYEGRLITVADYEKKVKPYVIGEAK